MKKWFLTALVLCILTADVQAAELTAVGRAVGIRLEEGAVTVTGFAEAGAAEAAGLREGDVIVSVNGCAVTRAEEIAPLISGGEPARIGVRRGDKTGEYLVPPVCGAEGWMLGIKVRDSISGIGTVTYYDSESGGYGALGHGVCADDGSLLGMTGGEVIGARVAAVEKGRRGAAGQLIGEFDASAVLGTVEKNTENGIFGHMPLGLDLGAEYETAMPGEVCTGAVTVLANVAGAEVQAYDAKILKIYPAEAQRNLLIEITDPRLLECTGGILQGMSGSPIIQDGKLVGAVTHVLVNDPTKGYGIFIENMLEAAG